MRWAKSNALALVLSAVTGVLVCLLFATDRRLGLHQFASTRYRFHAIPVAMSTLYHHRPHDYTALRNLAMRFTTPRGISTSKSGKRSSRITTRAAGRTSGSRTTAA